MPRRLFNFRHSRRGVYSRAAVIRIITVVGEFSRSPEICISCERHTTFTLCKLLYLSLQLTGLPQTGGALGASKTPAKEPVAADADADLEARYQL